MVKAISLDFENRIVVNIDGKFNVYLSALNPSEEFKKAFTEMHNQVEELTKTGNEKVKEVAKEYNDKIDILKNSTLGTPWQADLS